MSTVAKRLEQVKSKRRLRLGAITREGEGRELWLTDSGGREQRYLLRELATDFGRGFALCKLNVTGTPQGEYHILLDALCGDSCSCAGGSYVGRCKHADALREMVARGLL